MDVNATIEEMRKLSIALDCESETPLTPEQVERFAELFQALDQWCSRGGFLPRVWSDRQRMTDGPLALSVVNALRMLQQIAKRSTDRSSQALAQGAADDLLSKVPDCWIEG